MKRHKIALFVVDCKADQVLEYCGEFCESSQVSLTVTRSCHNQGRVVRKPVNANPGLKVNQRINLSSIKMFFTSYVLCSFRSHKLTTEGQTIQTEKLTEKLQN